VKIHQDIHAKKSIAIHWGTFELTDEPLDAPPKMLSAELEKAEITDDRFVVLKHGETVRF
jgi:L-ascorbate metabolism protein UlaG (beta-lactamase superfamily)